MRSLFMRGFSIFTLTLSIGTAFSADSSAAREQPSLLRCALAESPFALAGGVAFYMGYPILGACLLAEKLSLDAWNRYIDSRRRALEERRASPQYREEMRQKSEALRVALMMAPLPLSAPLSEEEIRALNVQRKLSKEENGPDPYELCEVVIHYPVNEGSGVITV